MHARYMRDYYLQMNYYLQRNYCLHELVVGPESLHSVRERDREKESG